MKNIVLCLLMSTFTVLGFAQVADSNNKIENVFNPPNIDNGRKKIVFNDDGFGLLYGHQIVGQIKTDDETKIIYKFVIYRTTDGINWKELKNSVLTKALSDTTSALGPRVVQGYSNGKQLLLASNSFVTYTSKDGLSWEVLNYYGKDIQDFRKNNIGTIWSSMFHVNSFSNYLCFSEFGNVNTIFKNENGNWKKIQKEKIDSSVNSETPRITIHVGRKTIYHAFDGYFFMKKQWPHYIFESNREVLKLAQNNELIKKSYGGTYSYPEEVFMPFTNAKIIYARFASGLFVSNDGGVSFRSLKSKIPFWPIDKVYNLCSDGTIFIAGAEKNTGYGKIWRSNDGGNNWKAMIDIRGSSLKSDPDSWDLDFLPDGKVVMVSNSINSGIYIINQGCGTVSQVDPCANAQKKIDVNISGISLIPQPNQHTCWAACAAMMHSWRTKKKFDSNNISEALIEIEGKNNGEFYKIFKESCDDCFNWSKGDWVGKGGLSQEQSNKFFIDVMKLSFHNGSIFDLNIKDCLPILAARCWDQPTSCKYQNGSHAVVITAVIGDGTPGCTLFKIIDPWHRDDKGKLMVGELVEETWTYAELISCCQSYAYYGKTPLSTSVSPQQETIIRTTSKTTSDLQIREIPVNKLIFISNAVNSNLKINIESGLAASQRKDGDWSAQWTIRKVPNTNYYWIENRWKTGERLHIETGNIQSEKINDDAWSAHWEFIQNGDFFIIQNRWKKAHKIHLENGKIECSIVKDDAKSSLWKLKTVE